MAAILLSDEARINISKGLPQVKRYRAFDNIPVYFLKVTMATQTVVTTIAGLLTTDVVTHGIEKQDTGGATALERAYVSAANTLSVKATTAPVGADGIISIAIHRPTTPV